MRLLAEGLMKCGFWLQLVLLGLVDLGTLYALAQGDGGPAHVLAFAVVNVGLVYAMAKIWAWLAKAPPPTLSFSAPEDVPAQSPSPIDRGLPWVGVAAFAATCGLMVFGAALPAEADTTQPAQVAETHTEGGHTVTIDARDRAEWVPFSLELGRVVPDGAAADLLLRRTSIRAPRGAARGDGAFVEDLPTGNPAFDRWYRFSLFDGGLSSRGEPYRVRLIEGTARVEIEGYHCPDGSMGCLRLRYQLPDG